MSRSRPHFGFSALLLVGCADVLGDVAVGQVSGSDPRSDPGSDPGIEVGTGTLVTPAPSLAPTPTGSETLPAPPVLDPGSSAAEMEMEEGGEAPPPPGLCEQGDFRCSGADVELCLNGMAWIPWQTCGSPRLCQSEPAGRCIPALCAPGQQRCVDGSLQRCDEELTGWTEVELCVSAAHCNPQQSQCLSAPCEAGQQRCNGDQLEICSEDRLGWLGQEQCASEALCESAVEPGSAACVAPSCSEGEFRCAESGALQVCNTELTGFDNIAQCATPALCNAELGRCEAPACSPAQHACTPEGELLICNQARSGFRAQQPAVICGELETCDAVRGVCEPIPLPPPPPPPPPEEPPVILDPGDDDDEPGRDNDGPDRDEDEDRGGREGRDDDDDDDDDDDRRDRDDDEDRGRGRDRD